MKSVFTYPLFRQGSLFVIAAWLSVFVFTSESLKFDSLESLFTGLALVAVIATFAHEREQSADREKEHTELLAAMKEQAKASAKLTNVEAMICLVDTFTRDHAAAQTPDERSAAWKSRTPWAKKVWEEAEKKVE